MGNSNPHACFGFLSLVCVCVCQRTDSGVILKYVVQLLGQGLVDSSSGIWLEGLIMSPGNLLSLPFHHHGQHLHVDPRD